MVVPVVGSRPFILFGADVTHPTSFDTSEPSIASVGASSPCCSICFVRFVFCFLSSRVFPAPRARQTPRLADTLERRETQKALTLTLALTLHLPSSCNTNHQSYNQQLQPNPTTKTVASFDRTLGRYASRTLAQAHRTEVIVGLKEAAKSLLTNFYLLSYSCALLVIMIAVCVWGAGARGARERERERHRVLWFFLRRRRDRPRPARSPLFFCSSAGSKRNTNIRISLSTSANAT